MSLVAAGLADPDLRSGRQAMMTALLEAQNLTKVYRRGDQEVAALSDVSFSADRGEYLLIMGPSGSGKSTLLNLLGGLDRPSSGRVVLAQWPIAEYTDKELSAFRRRRIGFVFQFFNLMPALTALENVALPLLLDGKSLASVSAPCRDLLRAVALTDRADHYPHQLSGGEMQRVAIARALASDPLLILADEPTGNLDSQDGAAVQEMLHAQVKARGHTLIMVSHDPSAARWSDRIIRLADGRISSDERRSGTYVQS